MLVELYSDTSNSVEIITEHFMFSFFLDTMHTSSSFTLKTKNCSNSDARWTSVFKIQTK